MYLSYNYPPLFQCAAVPFSVLFNVPQFGKLNTVLPPNNHYCLKRLFKVNGRAQTGTRMEINPRDNKAL